MLDYLKSFDGELEKRVKTLELNIRAASPSFFDTFRSIAECFVRRIAQNSGIETTATSFKKLMSIPELKQTLTESIGIPSYALDKCQDYISKINRHVHESEKAITENLVVEYIICLYELTSPISAEATPPEISEILSMYDSLDREIAKEKARLIQEQNKLISENNELLQLVSKKLNVGSAYNAPSKEAEKKSEAKKLLSDFISKSTQHLTFSDSQGAVNRKRKALLWLTAITLSLILIATVMSIALHKTYTPFILLADIWGCVLIVIIFKLKNESQRITNIPAQTINSTDYNSYGILRLGEVQKRYKAPFVLCMIGVTLEFIFALVLCFDNSAKGLASVLVILLITLTVLSIVLFAILVNYFGDLHITVLTSYAKRKPDGSPTVVYFIIDKFFDEDQYKKIRSVNSK